MPEKYAAPPRRAPLHRRPAAGRDSGLTRLDVLRMGRIGELAKLARDQVRRLLADVHGVVADPLEAARDGEHAEPPLELLWIPSELEHVLDCAAVCTIDQLVEIDER